VKKTPMVAAALSLLLAAGPAVAQGGYPEQTVRILVGFTPGVAPDITARLLAEKFSEAFGKPFVVENVSGAGGNIATERTARAEPNGHTLLMGGNASLIFAPGMGQKLAYDPVKDFAPISQVFIAANVLVVPSEVPAKTLPELIALARAQPGKLSYAHAGNGTSQQLAAELFKSLERLEIQPVAYRGTTHLLPDLLAGRVTMSFANVVNALPLVREGKLRAFAVTSLKRSALAPELPTMAESGYPGFEAVPWFGLMAPAGTPAAIIDRLHRETIKALAAPEARKRLVDLGLDVVGNSPSEFAALIEREIPQWGRVIRQAGIKASE
jgi:tripartite-type tricarboxylate transporter receptor subunit TctC